jgi:hypothetical protein
MHAVITGGKYFNREVTDSRIDLDFDFHLLNLDSPLITEGTKNISFSVPSV